MIEPLTVDIPEAELDDLRARLGRTRWPDQLPGTGWERGVPVSYLRGLADYWRDGYDWRRAERELNAVPNFATEVFGDRIHFVHVRSANPEPLALLLLHGWPGSTVEYIDLVDLLSPDFDLVIPSLPGHALSGPTTVAGWSDVRMAEGFLELMTRLGYERFGVHGGDTGSAVAPQMGRLAPERVVGVHVNALVTIPSDDPDDLASLTDRERDRLQRHRRFRETGMGYAQIQGTRPQTIAYALTDSPVGQLAWIVEKFKEWTNPAAELPEDAVDRDRLLTNVMLYWLTGTARSSASSYFERFRDPSAWRPAPPSGVPTGVAVFPTDVAIRRFAERSHAVTHWIEFDRGGHFPGLEAPELLARSIREFF